MFNGFEVGAGGQASKQPFQLPQKPNLYTYFGPYTLLRRDQTKLSRSFVWTAASPKSAPAPNRRCSSLVTHRRHHLVHASLIASLFFNSSNDMLTSRRSRKNKSKLLFTRRNLNQRRSFSFSVKNASSEPSQKLKDPIVEQDSSILSSFIPDAASIASSIKYHAEFTPSFSPERFELPKAFFATAQSVRDALIINWNATYAYYEKLNAKQAYYLSMEFLQGRALLNAIGNLELDGAYAEALSKLGHKLENVACQEPDAALGNGGLGRLASCFLDSLATLNYPAWGYGLRYKYGLFKQRITKDGQEKLLEDWLEVFGKNHVLLVADSCSWGIPGKL
ncbi:hypothetical protein GBA52_028620 [Prunus armeniaca]|nr:hypothetical protein GBA52_028620 [Prunus armeniaca]